MHTEPPTERPRPDGDARARLAMEAAIDAAGTVRCYTSPNPWVGAAVVDEHGVVVATGATEPPGGRHAEIVALDELADTGRDVHDLTLATTLEPCCHHGRTPPCTERIIASGVGHVAVGITDPDPHVAGRGVARLRSAGVDVSVGVLADDVERQLTPYVHHRRTGRPYVVCKLAATLDGATAAPDGTSRWITGESARHDAHRLRAESDAILVGAGTVRADDPALTVRHADGPDPRRVVLGTAPGGAKVHPCLEWSGELTELLDHLGCDGVVQLMVEGGAATAGAFHSQGLVDRYVFYLAPALMGGLGGAPALDGAAAPTIGALWRGRIDDIVRLGDDLRVDVVPSLSAAPSTDPEGVD